MLEVILVLVSMPITDILWGFFSPDIELLMQPETIGLITPPSSDTGSPAHSPPVSSDSDSSPGSPIFDQSGSCFIVI